MSLDRPSLRALLLGALLLWPLAARAQQQRKNPFHDKDLATLRQALKSGAQLERRQAALEVANRGEDAAAAVPELIACFEVKDPTLHLYACFAAGRVGPAAKAAAPQIIGLLRNSSEQEIRRYAAFAIGRIDPPVSRALPALIVATSDKYKEARLSAINALGALGPEAAAAIPRLARILEDTRDGQERLTTIRALGELGAKPPQGLKALMARLEQRYEEVIVWALGAMGEGAAEAAPLLLRLFASSDPVRRTVIAEALGRIRADAAIPALEAALKDPDINTRYRADEALARIRAEK